jgi:hypothetical protein
MGPSILFDKSAIQSLRREAIYEISRYFYTVVPPVLLMETLADLSLEPDDLENARKKVAKIAAKVFPIDSIANAHHQPMCVHNLLGDYVPMKRKPAVEGARPVTAKDGTKGLIIDLQAENEAVMRWRSGRFNHDDLKFAVEWRANATGWDFEALKHSLPKPQFRLRTGEQVASFVDLMLADPDLQLPLLHWHLRRLGCDSNTSDRVLVRWKWDIFRSLRLFAPYAYHCLRVQLLFFIGMMQGVFSSRPTNIVDLEYLYYTPFASVFCSGDNFHRQLVPFVLRNDQSFVERQDLQKALMAMAAARQDTPDAEPGDDSLIRRIRLKHWNPSQAMRPPVSEEESKRLTESIEPIMQALRENARQPTTRFPV